MAKVKSPKGSLKGWNAWTWFKGNYKTLKELAKVGLPLLVASGISVDPATIGLLTVVGKALIDVLEYAMKTY